MKPYYIYGLVCPVEGKIFYVGCTNNVSTRLNCHKANRGGVVGIYIANLAKKNLHKKITIEILEVVNAEDFRLAAQIETFWIHEIGKTNVLKNTVKEHWGLFRMTGKRSAIKALNEFRKENIDINADRRRVVRRLKSMGLLNNGFRKVLDKSAVSEWNKLMATI